MLKQIAVAAVSIALASCGGEHTSDSGAVKTAAAPPTLDELLALDRQAQQAYMKGDGQFFERLLSDNVVMTSAGRRVSKPEVIKVISGIKCNIREGWSLTEPSMEKIDNDVYVLSFKTAVDGACTAEGKTEKQPSPVRAATVWLRNGARWQAAFHAENPIVDPSTLSQTKHEEVSKQDNPKKDTAADPGAAGMMAAERSVWEAWKAKDAKKLEDLTAEEIAFADIFGNYFANKADVIKSWTGSTCDVKSFSLTDEVATSISPNVGILTLTSSVDGNCRGQKPPTVYAASVYVKHGDDWKWAFGFNSPH